MTEQDKHRQDFWVARFTEKLQSKEYAKQKDDMKIKVSKVFADACLVQYDITFNQTTKG
jgi:hypothetical protein